MWDRCLTLSLQISTIRWQLSPESRAHPNGSSWHVVWINAVHWVLWYGQRADLTWTEAGQGPVCIQFIGVGWWPGNWDREDWLYRHWWRCWRLTWNVGHRFTTSWMLASPNEALRWWNLNPYQMAKFLGITESVDVLLAPRQDGVTPPMIVDWWVYPIKAIFTYFSGRKCPRCRAIKL